MVDAYSLSFFGAAALAALAFCGALVWLPESLGGESPKTIGGWPPIKSRDKAPCGLKSLLALAFAVQFALATFETVFALYSQKVLAYSVSQVGMALMVCALVMAVLEGGPVGLLSERIPEISLIRFGFFLTGAGLVLVLAARSLVVILAFVALMASGIALIVPPLASLFSKSRSGGTGKVLGLQNAAYSLGLTAGPIVGSLVFTWHAGAPLVITGFIMVTIGILLWVRVHREQPYHH